MEEQSGKNRVFDDLRPVSICPAICPCGQRKQQGGQAGPEIQGIMRYALYKAYARQNRHNRRGQRSAGARSGSRAGGRLEVSGNRTRPLEPGKHLQFSRYYPKGGAGAGDTV